MIDILYSTSFLFLSILLGIIFGRFKIFEENSPSILIRYVFYIALPASLFITCYREKLSLFNGHYLASYICSEIALILLFIFVTLKILKGSFSVAILNCISVTQVNGAYFVIPLYLLLFKSVEAVIPLIFIQNAIFFTLLVFLLEVASQDKENQNTNKIKSLIKNLNNVIFKNPMIMSSVVGLLLDFGEVPIPSKFIQFLDFFSKSASPVALFAIGLSFSINFKISNLKSDEMKSSILVTLGKVILLPAVAFIIGCLFNLPKEFLGPLVIMCASPSAIHSYVIANQYKLNGSVQTNVVVFSTALCFLTINLFIYFLR